MDIMPVFPNPLVPLYEGGQKFTKRHETSGIFKLEYNIIDGLKFTGIANVKYTFKNEESRSRKMVYKSYFTGETIEKELMDFPTEGIIMLTTTCKRC